MAMFPCFNSFGKYYVRLMCVQVPCERHRNIKPYLEQLQTLNTLGKNQDRARKSKQPAVRGENNCRR